MGIFSCRQIYVPTFKYFLVVTVQWNFLHNFLTSMQCFWIYFEIQNIFSKNLHFVVCVRNLETFLWSVQFNCSDFELSSSGYSSMKFCTQHVFTYTSDFFLDLFRNSKYFSITLFCVSDFEHFCDQYSSIVPTFNYLRVATVHWNFLHSFLSLIPRNIYV